MNQEAFDEKQARSFYGLPETATEDELKQAREAFNKKQVRSFYGLPETATEDELKQATQAYEARRRHRNQSEPV